MSEIHTRIEALQLLQDWYAPERLLHHARLVSDVAESILDCISPFCENLDGSLVLIGAVLHDIGKIQHPEELHKPGHQHESAGYEMLMANAISQPIADMCISHSQWEKSDSMEALIVALADNLWKGKRVRELEDRIIQYIANSEQRDFWRVWTSLDRCFEQIAEDAPTRIAETRYT